MPQDDTKPFPFDEPLDRQLRRMYERDMWSYPAEEKLRHAQLLGKPVIDEWVGDTPVYKPAPHTERRVAIFFDPPEHFSWDSSQ